MNLKFIPRLWRLELFWAGKRQRWAVYWRKLGKSLSQILQEDIILQAASRTDAGVHAEGQVINLKTQKEGLNLKKLKRD